jgi:hypothetical protein
LWQQQKINAFVDVQRANVLSATSVKNPVAGGAVTVVEDSDAGSQA